MATAVVRTVPAIATTTSVFIVKPRCGQCASSEVRSRCVAKPPQRGSHNVWMLFHQLRHFQCCFLYRINNDVEQFPLCLCLLSDNEQHILDGQPFELVM